jgi:aryl-alcohol dehydrogenase-like predicted oxidoreductase
LVLSGRVDSVQTVINIFDPLALDCLVPLCAARGVAVLARCVLDEGGLAGALAADSSFHSGDFRARYFDMGPRPAYLARVQALRGFVPQYAGSLASLALKFVLKHPGVSTALSSMHLKAHAEENIRAADEPPLSEETFDTLFRKHRWIRNFYHSKVL